MDRRFDVIVIGGGQSGLAVGYYLRRSGLSYTILDNQHQPGGAWLHAWKSLKLFSPAQWSSLPGMMMTGGSSEYPSRDATLAYLAHYEEKYGLSVQRPVTVTSVAKQNDEFIIETSSGPYVAKAVVSATGSFMNPQSPAIEGIAMFKGVVLHSSQYISPDAFAGKCVAIVGEGNSGAQILAEVSRVAETRWVTQKEPRFLPDHIDGKFLFDAATQIYEARQQGKAYNPPSLGDIVMVDSVKEARERNVFKSLPPIARFEAEAIVLTDGRTEGIDAVIFCTGFKPALAHLAPLRIVNAAGRVDTVDTKAAQPDGLWLVGYGNWTGFASATLIGVGRSAKATVDQVKAYLGVTV